jgi:hypothetical protein
MPDRTAGDLVIDVDPADFFTALNDELDEISKARTQRDFLRKLASKSSKEIKCPRASHLIGLAISGGGIRSAPFNSSVLQSLVGLHLSRIVDNGRLFSVAVTSGSGPASGYVVLPVVVPLLISAWVV